MYGFINSSSNLFSAQSTPFSPNSQQQQPPQQSPQQQEQQQHGLPTRVFFTSPPPLSGPEEAVAHGASFTLYNLIEAPAPLAYQLPQRSDYAPPPQQQPQQLQQQESYTPTQLAAGTTFVAAATSNDAQWSRLYPYTSGGATFLPSSATGVNVIVTSPQRAVEHNSTEHAAVGSSHVAHSLPPSQSLQVPPRDAHAASNNRANANVRTGIATTLASPATDTHTAFRRTDASRGYGLPSSADVSGAVPSTASAATTPATTTTTSFTPLFLSGVNDSRRASCNVGAPHHVDAGGEGASIGGPLPTTTNAVLFQSLSNCNVSQFSPPLPPLPPQQQPQQPQQYTSPFAVQRHGVVSPPGPVSAVLASDVVSYAPSSAASAAFSVPSARDTALETPSTLFTTLGTALASPVGHSNLSTAATYHHTTPSQLSNNTNAYYRHHNNSSSNNNSSSTPTHYALPQQLTQAVSFQQFSAAGGSGSPTIHTFLIEQPAMGPQGSMQLTQSTAAATCSTSTVPNRVTAAYTMPSPAMQQEQQQQQQQRHVDPTREREAQQASQDTLRRRSFNYVNKPAPERTFAVPLRNVETDEGQARLRQRQQQQQQQQQHQHPQQSFVTPFSPSLEHPRPDIAQAERRNSMTISTLNDRSARPSLNSGLVVSRRPTRVSLTSLNSAALSNSINDYQFQQQQQQQHQQQQQQQQAPKLPTFQRPPTHPRPDEDQSKPTTVLSQPLPQHSLSLSQQDTASANLASLANSLPSAKAAPSTFAPNTNANTNTAAAAAPATTITTTTATTSVLTPDAAHVAVNSPPPSPSRSVARRNRERAVLFVGQLNYEATEADVTQIFACYGKPLSVVVLKDKGKGTRRGNGGGGAARGSSHAGAGGSGGPQRKVGGSAFVTYGTTLEADTAISALHGRYNAKDDDPDHDDEAKYLQVSYGQQTGLISAFGTQHAEKLHASKPENPIPLIVLERRKAKNAVAKAE